MEIRLKIVSYFTLIIFHILTFGNWGFTPILALALITAVPVFLMLPTVAGFKLDQNDKWLSTKGNLKVYGYYDKLEHAFFYVPLVFTFVTFMYWLAEAPFDLKWRINTSLAVFALGLFKEFFDSSFYARNQKGILAGDGFSIKDVIANIIGIVAMNIISLFIF